MNALVNVTPNYGVSDLERMARAFAASKLFGVQNPEQALALCLVAQAEGRHPASAAQDYHIISGRPAKKADAMLRDFISAGGKVEWHALSNEHADATFSHPYGGTVRIDWDLTRAKEAGITNPMWKKYPRQMLRSRVVSEGVRTVCPGATSGMYVPEEMQDIVHEQATSGTSSQARLAAPADDVKDAVLDDGVPSAREQFQATAMRLMDSISDVTTEADIKAWWPENQRELDMLPDDLFEQVKAHYEDHWTNIAKAAKAKSATRTAPPADFNADELEGAFNE